METLRNATNVAEDLANKSWKLLVKWKDVIDEWTQAGGEKEAVRFKREEALSRGSYLKRTNRYEKPNYRNSNGSSSRSDERSIVIMRKLNL